MARKLHPNEEYAFFQASLPPFIMTPASARMRLQPGIDGLSHFDEPSPDLVPEAPTWDDSSWPDDWTW